MNIFQLMTEVRNGRQDVDTKWSMYCKYTCIYLYMYICPKIIMYVHMDTQIYRIILSAMESVKTELLK